MVVQPAEKTGKLAKTGGKSGERHLQRPATSGATTRARAVLATRRGIPPPSRRFPAWSTQDVRRLDPATHPSPAARRRIGRVAAARAGGRGVVGAQLPRARRRARALARETRGGGLDGGSVRGRRRRRPRRPP